MKKSKPKIQHTFLLSQEALEMVRTMSEQISKQNNMRISMNMVVELAIIKMANPPK